MSRKALLWLSAIVAVAVLVAYQAVTSSAGECARKFAARADVPAVQPGVDVLSGIVVVPARIHHYDYRRAGFGDAWTDDTDAPGGHNGCDTRNDILNRDLVDKTNVATKRCPAAIATGILHDPYTNATINFQRGAGVGASVQIDHIVSVATTKKPAIRAVQRIDYMSSSSTGQLAESFADSERIDYVDRS